MAQLCQKSAWVAEIVKKRTLIIGCNLQRFLFYFYFLQIITALDNFLRKKGGFLVVMFPSWLFFFLKKIRHKIYQTYYKMLTFISFLAYFHDSVFNHVVNN